MALPNAQYVGLQPEGLWPTSLGLFLGRAQSWLAFGAMVVTFTAAAVAAASVAEQAITAGVTQTTVNDIAILVAIGAPTANVALLGTGRVSAANTIQGRYVNPTAAALTPPAAQTIFIATIQVR